MTEIKLLGELSLYWQASECLALLVCCHFKTRNQTQNTTKSSNQALFDRLVLVCTRFRCTCLKKVHARTARERNVNWRGKAINHIQLMYFLDSK